MASLTVNAAMAIAMQCLPPDVAQFMAPVVVGDAIVESHLDPLAIRHNSNGTLDVGISQINTSNFHWTGLTMETALDPCQSFRTALKVFFAKYNGNPPEAIKQAYAARVTSAIGKVTVLRRLEDLPIGPLGSVPAVAANAMPTPFQRPSRTSASMTFAPPDRKD